MFENSIHVLLIEDNPGDAYLLQQFLQGAGNFQWEAFCSLKAGFDYLDQTALDSNALEPDVILLDLSLPDSHGLATIKAAVANIPAIPIVILTSLNDEALATAALREGAQDYLIKGEISQEVVVRSIHYAIERAGLNRQLRESEARLRLVNKELAHAARLKDEFLANMSHEIRTPLNAILGMTEGLQEQVFGKINEQQLKALQTIERSGAHLLGLINDILDVAKIEAGKITIDCTPTSVGYLCRSSLAFIKRQAQKKKIALDVKLPLHLPDLCIDERRIRQALINLLNNAVKFTQERGRITLEVSYHQQPADPGWTDVSQQNFLQIAVIDTGIGIAPEHFSKLFQPFIQLDSSLNRKYEGTGLGLALVKRIVELHGGQVGVTSEVGVGSCFTINLPCSEVVPSICQSGIPSESSPETHQSDPIIPPLILLAEDNEANINSMSSYLEVKGYRILLARNGHEAIAQAQLANPDLILMDIQMPGMDGLEAMQKIRHVPDLKDVPIIALTALAMTGDRERCLVAGASEYLSKPVKLKQLATTIHQLLGAR